VGGRQFGNWEFEQVLELERIAADLADHGHSRQRLGRARYDETRPEVLPERVEARGQPPAGAHLARDTAFGQGPRDPALGDVMCTLQRTRPHRLPDPVLRVEDRL